MLYEHAYEVLDPHGDIVIKYCRYWVDFSRRLQTTLEMVNTTLVQGTGDGGHVKV